MVLKLYIGSRLQELVNQRLDGTNRSVSQEATTDDIEREGDMDVHRATAIRVALDEIDGNLDVYDTTEKQDALLQKLIDLHDLKDSPKANNGEEVTLTTERYRMILGDTASNHSRSGHSRGDIFLRGSALVKKRYLRRINLLEAAVSVEETGNSLGDEGDEVVAGEAAQEAKSATRKRPHSESLQAPQVDNAPTAMTNEIIDAPPPAKKQRASSAAPIVKVPVPAEALPQTRQTQQKSKVEATPSVIPASVAPVSALASSLTKLSKDEVSKSFNSIWTHIGNLTLSIMNGAGVTWKARVQWVPQPSEDLQTIYERLFGSGWKDRTREISQSRHTKVREILAVCLAASIYVHIFMPALPWDGPQDILVKLRGSIPSMDTVMSSDGYRSNIASVVWKSAQVQVREAEFQEKVIKPAAMEKAKTIMLVLDSKLDRLGLYKPTHGKENAVQFWQERTDDLADIVQSAMVLKGMIKAAPDYYKPEWPASGRPLDRGSVEEIHRSEGKQEVLWGVSPIMRSKRRFEDKQWELVAKGKAATRPR